ncbi:restriction endonuclease subunit S [Campylobacter sp. LH-2024]|uniref:restriction endonuclease subunit S n=1 Tax=Campylobacter TaxID=194 RepID=UPI00301C9EC6|nr:restriction endonuclease subunit S [Campylobacter sp. W0046]
MKNLKNSGIEWLGEIPEHWEIKRLRYVGYIFGGLTGKTAKDFNREYQKGFKPYITFTNVCNNTIIDSNKMEYVSIGDLETQNKVLKNDILFLQTSETFDDIGKTAIYLDDKEVYLNTFCKGFRVEKSAYPLFLNYIFISLTYKRYFLSNCSGFTRINLRQEHLLDIPLILPPLKEQEQIANFLDEKCEKIQNFIEKKEKLLSLLQEQKQALINETITKGLDKNVKLKNSGIEWLGEIPEHWEMVRLANFGIFLKGNGISRQDLIEDGEPAIHYGDIYTKYEISTTALKSRISTETAQNITSIHNGDILFAGSGETKEDIGKNIVYLGKEKAFAGGDVIIFRQKKNNALFLSYALNTKYVKSLKGIDSKGEIIVHIYASNLKDIKIPIPPLKEQEQIANFLDEKCEKIDSLITKIKKQIELIKEYKTTLINEAVCGRMDLK